jgi:hypothetical protein
MTPASAPTESDAGWTQLADAWQSSSTTDLTFEVYAALGTADFSNSDIWVGARFTSLGAASRQISVAITDGTSAFYQAEVYDDGTMTARTTLVYWDGSAANFFGSGSSYDYGSDHPLGLLSVHLRAREAPAEYAADMNWPAQSAHVELQPADLNNYVGGDRLFVYVQNAVAEITYLFVVTTTP